MTRSVARAALLALLLAPVLTPAPAAAQDLAAQDFEDSASGLRVAVPEGFRATPGRHPGYDVAVGLDPVSGTPRRAGTGPHLCQLAWVSAPQNARLTQDEINRLSTTPEREATIRSAMERAFVVEALRPFTLGKVAGTELTGTPRAGPGAGEARVLTSLAETPRGRMTMICAVHRGDEAAGMAVLRRLRDGVRLPG